MADWIARPLIIAFLQAAGRRVKAWANGSVFLHFTGHGFFDGETAATARPGAELACRAHNLPSDHPAPPRGAISYFATEALAEAATMGDWLARIEALVQLDVESNLLPSFYRPDLWVLGDIGWDAPG